MTRSIVSPRSRAARQVDLDVASRIHDDRAAGRLVADEIRRVRQALQVELLEDHRRRRAAFDTAASWLRRCRFGGRLLRGGLRRTHGGGRLLLRRCLLGRSSVDFFVVLGGRCLLRRRLLRRACSRPGLRRGCPSERVRFFAAPCRPAWACCLADGAWRRPSSARSSSARLFLAASFFARAFFAASFLACDWRADLGLAPSRRSVRRRRSRSRAARARCRGAARRPPARRTCGSRPWSARRGHGSAAGSPIALSGT